MEFMSKLGFNFAAKYIPQIFDFSASYLANYVAQYDHIADGDKPEDWYLFGCKKDQCKV